MGSPNIVLVRLLPGSEKLMSREIVAMNLGVCFAAWPFRAACCVEPHPSSAANLQAHFGSGQAQSRPVKPSQPASGPAEPSPASQPASGPNSSQQPAAQHPFRGTPLQAKNFKVVRLQTNSSLAELTGHSQVSETSSAAQRPLSTRAGGKDDGS